MISRFLIALFRWLKSLFRKARKPFKPSFDKPGSWASFVKTFHFDQLSGPGKRAAFRQIMSFRS